MSICQFDTIVPYAHDDPLPFHFYNKQPTILTKHCCSPNVILVVENPKTPQILQFVGPVTSNIMYIVRCIYIHANLIVSVLVADCLETLSISICVFVPCLTAFKLQLFLPTTWPKTDPGI